MNYRKLGKTGFDMSEVGLGTWALGGPVTYQNFSVGWRKIDESVAERTVAACHDAGVNFIDTADIYGEGRAETIIGRALHHLPDRGKRFIIATKVGFDIASGKPPGKNQDFSENYIRRACENSLKRLQRETIDLYQLHCPPLAVIEKGEVFGVLERLQEAGKIRAYGVSIVTDNEALAAMKYSGVSSVQIIFNIFRQGPLEKVFPMAVEKNVGILARVPLASGLLTGKFKPGHQFEVGDHRKQGIPGETFSGVKFAKGLELVEKLRPLAHPGVRTLAQAALAYTLHTPAVSSVIPGAVTPEQLAENAGASAVPRLTATELSLCQTFAKI